MTSIGKGTKAAKELVGFVDEIEVMRARVELLKDAEKEIFARAKSAGFDLHVLRDCLNLRKQDKIERDQYQHLLDIYMHALGEDEPPLFTALGAVGVDLAAREHAVEFLKTIVPPKGELTLKVGGQHIRVYRDGDGNPHAEDAVAAPEASVKPKRAKREPATVTPIQSAADRAEAAWRNKQKPQPTDDPLPTPPGPPETPAPETPS